MKALVLAGVYETAIDRESAYEKLKGKVAASPAAGTGAVAAGSAPATPVGVGIWVAMASTGARLR